MKVLLINLQVTYINMAYGCQDKFPIDKFVIDIPLYFYCIKWYESPHIFEGGKSP